MSVGTLVSVEEYLKTVYRPDCDYVDGVVEERCLGELDHAWLAGRLVLYIMNRFTETGIAAIAELRFQVKPTRFRVPDVLLTLGKPTEQILTKSPLLCIEILSPEDTIPRMNTKVRDYLDFGVPAVWVIDPREKTIWIYRQNGMQEATGESVKVDGTNLTIPFTAIFD
jgi:Uma2 family endonuclease